MKKRNKIKGVAGTEYAMLVSLIGAMAVGTAYSLGGEIGDSARGNASALETAVASAKSYNDAGPNGQTSESPDGNSGAAVDDDDLGTYTRHFVGVFRDEYFDTGATLWGWHPMPRDLGFSPGIYEYTRAAQAPEFRGLNGNPDFAMSMDITGNWAQTANPWSISSDPYQVCEYADPFNFGAGLHEGISESDVQMVVLGTQIIEADEFRQDVEGDGISIPIMIDSINSDESWDIVGDADRVTPAQILREFSCSRPGLPGDDPATGQQPPPFIPSDD